MENLTAECGTSWVWTNVQANANLAAYYILPPALLSLGLLSNLVGVVAFYKEASQDNKYIYQTCLMANSACEAFSTATMCLFLRRWSGFIFQGSELFMGNYALMWYTAHCSMFLATWFTTSSVMVSAAMAADRAFAVLKPFVYRGISHKKHQIVAIIVCHLISVLTSLIEAVRFDVVSERSHYIIALNQAVAEAPGSALISSLRDITRGIGLLVLIICNACFVCGYLKLNTRQTQAFSKRGAEKKAEVEQTLMTLTVCQCTLVGIGTFLATACFILLCFRDMICFVLLLLPIVDGVTQLRIIVDVFVLMAVSKQFRRVVVDVLMCRYLPVVSTSLNNFLGSRGSNNRVGASGNRSNDSDDDGNARRADKFRGSNHDESVSATVLTSVSRKILVI